MLVTAVVIAVVIGGAFATASFWVDWWWYGSLGYREVLVTQYVMKLLAFVVAGLVAGLFYWFNWRRAQQQGAEKIARGQGVVGTGLRTILMALTALVVAVAGFGAADRWEDFRLFLSRSDFGVKDPIYGHDVGFYVFTLPALLNVWWGATALLAITLVTVFVIYFGQGLRRRSFNPSRLGAAPKTHLLLLAGAMVLAIGLGYLLRNYALHQSTRGFAYGIGYTDATVVRPLHWFLAALSVVAAGIIFLNARTPRTKPLLLAAVAWGVAVLLGIFLPNFVQQALVVPNQLSRERPFIVNNLAMTQAAFGLDQTETREISGAGEPPAAELAPNTPTFDNIRLWDYRIVRQTFQQIRSFVPFYVFHDVDVDRYQLAAGEQQVLSSAREVDTSQLQPNAQTWVNLHLAYTHGYAMVVSPISTATRQGLPEFLVGGIPPEGTGPLAITRPEIYFGERSGTWVATHTDQPEISALGDDASVKAYEGTAYGSVTVGNFFKRVLLAFYLKDQRVLLSRELRSDSQVLLRQQVSDRAQAAVPFLRLDPDPYLTIADGRLVWIIDAYATTDRFPSATPIAEGFNYMRNTARITVDAYTGQVTVYRTVVHDPITDAWASVYPGVFRPISEAPAAVSEHFRYPEELYKVQTEVYAAYHLTDPDAFYNGEDRWSIAMEETQGADGANGEPRPMEAYYMTLPLPGEQTAGFKLVVPFTPINRQNMTAWMAGQGNADGSSRLVLYRFPRQSNIFGPQQVEARINQDPAVSSQITLLDRSGSRVIRGNLLVIPIGESVLYAQPLYLQATASGGAPTELRFVILATQEQVVMRPTLAEALTALAAGQGEPAAASGSEGNAPTTGTGSASGTSSPGSAAPVRGTDAEIAAQALDALNRAQQARDAGDLNGYESAMVDLRHLLEAMTATGPVGTPAAGATPVP